PGRPARRVEAARPADGHRRRGLRRDRRPAGGRGGGGHAGGPRLAARPPHRRRGGRDPSPAGRGTDAAGGRRHRGGGRDGGRPGLGRRRPGRRPDRGRADQRRLRLVAGGRHRPPGHAGQLRPRGGGHGHRQRLRRRRRRRPHPGRPGTGPDGRPPVTTVAWFHCFAGIAGDMALGACLDAGAPLDEVVAILDRLPLTGWRLDTEDVMRGGLAATKAQVKAESDTITRTYGHIAGIIEEARLPARVRERAQRVFRLLAEAEARLHRRPVAAVHFHEVGGIDAIVDIVGTCAALETLGIDEVRASTVRVGTGVVRTSHGLLPNPSPAVVELLKEAPVVGLDVNAELTTPTGAALLAGLCAGYGPMPPMRLLASGFGAGTRELPALPNLVQVAVGETASATAGGGGTDGAALAAQPLARLEANLDDVSGEVVA